MSGLTEERLERLRTAVPQLLDWFETVRRPLPWRQQPTPYAVWVSEIMLQQTRIEAVIPYYERFMQALPTVEALANAEEDMLLKLWEGLGYYSRVRNLQKAARQVMERHGGELPADHAALLALSGIGEYTAGAIASIAFGIAVPAVDGNVLRVLARLTDCDDDIMKPAVKRQFTAWAAALLPTAHAGAFNQAMMELGERVCLPNTAPRCDACPFAAVCDGAASGRAASLPTRSPKKARRVEQRTVLIVTSPEGQVLLHRRDTSGLLAGLWELPNEESVLSPEQAAALAASWGGEPKQCDRLADGKHIFTHVEWHMAGYHLPLTARFDPPDGWCWANLREVSERFALPTAFRPFSALLPILLKS